MVAKRELTGERFGRLVVLHEAPKTGSKIRWFCQCDCGNETSVQSSNLTTGHTLSCGCLNREINSERAIVRNTVHGHNKVSKKSDTWQSWHAMKCRCEKRSHKSYPSYGWRGITICKRWSDDFREFLNDMGERPDSNHSIERIDVNGNYEPSNCRWATATEQQHNRRDNWWKWAVNDNGEWVRATA